MNSIIDTIKLNIEKNNNIFTLNTNYINDWIKLLSNNDKNNAYSLLYNIETGKLEIIQSDKGIYKSNTNIIIDTTEKNKYSNFTNLTTEKLLLRIKLQDAIDLYNYQKYTEYFMLFSIIKSYNK